MSPREATMRNTRLVALALIASVLLGAFPGIARADEQGNPRPAATAKLQTSIDRAATELARQPLVKQVPEASIAKSAQFGGGGGGGGKTMLIVSLVTTVVGLAATYYI